MRDRPVRTQTALISDAFAHWDDIAVHINGETIRSYQKRIATNDLPGQFRQMLINIRAILAVADAGPEHIVRLTWYITDRDAYLAAQAEIGAIWREQMGRNYPAMAVVTVTALMEAAAKIEIEATAVLPAG
ncbi:RidA family protein [Sphingomonas alpina]|uniref:RidA family protein n=1 Tax=Sphingomonas alpina TaxID=653931 RepID=A0A7H0LFM9_9SPHN|nr:RidA family protein [Sphingomonas alpina]QNQ08482.1 RidA family protein [Sphingomonas alpina]